MGALGMMGETALDNFPLHAQTHCEEIISAYKASSNYNTQSHSQVTLSLCKLDPKYRVLSPQSARVIFATCIRTREDNHQVNAHATKWGLYAINVCVRSLYTCTAHTRNFRKCLIDREREPPGSGLLYFLKKVRACVHACVRACVRGRGRGWRGRG